MKKSYSITYGVKGVDVEAVTSILEKECDFSFEKRTSDYIGDYNLYKGLFADRLSIETNFHDGSFKEADFQEYETLIYVAIDSGRNKDKESKYKSMKKALSKIPEFVLLKDVMIEEAM